MPTACDEIFELITAANYMNIKPLLEAACHLVADMIKVRVFCYRFLTSLFQGKTPEDIRKLFDIKNDFTPEEEEQIRKENEWCQDR